MLGAKNTTKNPTKKYPQKFNGPFHAVGHKCMHCNTAGKAASNDGNTVLEHLLLTEATEQKVH